MIPRIMNSKVYGLKGRPTWEPEHSDCRSAQHPELARPEPKHDNSDDNLTVVENMSRKTREGGILEIGVALYNPERTFTHRILKHKPDSIPYLGVDIEDKSFLNNRDKLIYTLKCDSFNQGLVRSKLWEIGITKIGMLVIDGHHSVNMAINDWQYADLLSEDGIVIVHDTNSWLGPVALIEALDTDMFQCQKFCVNDKDYGITVIRGI